MLKSNNTSYEHGEKLYFVLSTGEKIMGNLVEITDNEVVVNKAIANSWPPLVEGMNMVLSRSQIVAMYPPQI